MSRRSKNWSALWRAHADGQVNAGIRNGICHVLVPDGVSPRTRKVVIRSNWHRTQKFPSRKAGRMVQSESRSEFYAHHLLEVDPTIQSFAEQPYRIIYVLEGKEREHYPDIRVERHDGRREIWEVKSAKDAGSPFIRARTAFMQEHLAALGYTYRVALNEDLERQPRLNNLRLLLKFGRYPVDVVTREHIRQLAARADGIPWKAAREGVLGTQGRFALCRLVLDGLLTVDLESPVCADTRFSSTESPKALLP